MARNFTAKIKRHYGIIHASQDELQGEGIRKKNGAQAPRVCARLSEGFEHADATQSRLSESRGTSPKADTSVGVLPKMSPKEGVSFPIRLLSWRPEIYDDSDVCRLLQIRKRKLIRYRKSLPRGSETWDIIDQQAGFTGEWVRRLLSIGKPSWANWIHQTGIRRIEPGNGIVTVEFIQRFENTKIAGVKILSSGRRTLCHVRDTCLMTLGEQFDCKQEMGSLYWERGLNPEVY